MGHEGWKPRTYSDFDDIRAELDRFQDAHDAGTLEARGNWSAAQILKHCSEPYHGAFDGAPDVEFPWVMRAAGRFVFKPMLGRSHMKPGIKLPKKMKAWLPKDETPFDEGMGAMRSAMDRLEAGEQMTHPSPLMGRMSHEQWTKLNLDHCRLHFGFLHYPGV